MTFNPRSLISCEVVSVLINWLNAHDTHFFYLIVPVEFFCVKFIQLLQAFFLLRPVFSFSGYIWGFVFFCSVLNIPACKLQQQCHFSFGEVSGTPLCYPRPSKPLWSWEKTPPVVAQSSPPAPHWQSLHKHMIFFCLFAPHNIQLILKYYSKSSIFLYRSASCSNPIQDFESKNTFFVLQQFEEFCLLQLHNI